MEYRIGKKVKKKEKKSTKYSNYSYYAFCTSLRLKKQVVILGL